MSVYRFDRIVKNKNDEAQIRLESGETLGHISELSESCDDHLSFDLTPTSYSIVRKHSASGEDERKYRIKAVGKFNSPGDYYRILGKDVNAETFEIEIMSTAEPRIYLTLYSKVKMIIRLPPSEVAALIDFSSRSNNSARFLFFINDTWKWPIFYPDFSREGFDNDSLYHCNVFLDEASIRAQNANAKYEKFSLSNASEDFAYTIIGEL